MQVGPRGHGGTDRLGRFDRLILLLMLAALVVVWSVSLAYGLAERHRIVERVQGQLTVIASTLADLNELAESAGGSPQARNAQRTAAIWRALLQYPTARIWVESGGVVTAGQAPAPGSPALVSASEKRANFTVHAALPLGDALADWRRTLWQGGSLLLALSAVFLLLTRALTRAMRERAAAERTAAAAQERSLQLARYRRELEETVAQRTAELRDANARLHTELTEREAAEAALRQHDGLLRAVTGSAGELLGSHSFEEAIPSVLALIGRTLAVSRVQIEAGLVEDEGRRRVQLRHEWCAPGVVPLADDPAFREIDLAAAYAEAAPAHDGPVDFFVDDIAQPHRGLFAAAGMRSFLQIPVRADGTPWGRLDFIDSAAARRQWSWAETDTLQTLAELIGTAITRARYLRELADANMIVQNSPTILYRLRGEPSLPMMYISHNITKFGHDPAALIGSANWPHTLIDPQDQAKVGAAMARLLDEGAQAAAIEFRLVTGDGGRRWVENRYTPVRDANGRLVEIEGIIIDITERKAAEEKIAQLARTDPLTGLANRATFLERLRQAFAATGRGASPFAILYLDLDRFKNVNDTLGHTAGDELLREVAKRLEAGTRESDLVARLGGDEFAVLQTEMSEPASAGTLAAHLRNAIAQPFHIGGSDIHTTASVGISPFVPGTAGPEAMLTQADLALYRAKEEGRDRYCFHSPELDRQMYSRVMISEDLQNALVQKQLEVYYQPQIDLVSGGIVGMEALVRWHHPRRGLLFPADFIPVAEKTGAIVPLGRWVLDEACRQMRQWQDDGVAPPVVAVNLSLSELASGSALVRHIAETIGRWGLVPGQIEFDVTEATLAHVTWMQNDVLARLHDLGARIAIDDFGTEYSSFDYLRTYRINHLKLAQSFIRKAVEDPGRAATIRAIISLARELGIEVIAEGVETREQRNFLIETGSAQAQGFFFSKPVAAARAGELLRQGHIRPPDFDGARAPQKG